MDCEKQRISCAIADLAAILESATPWEKAAVLVAALGALGTIWIAILNLRILRKQQELAVAQEASAARERRFDVADALTTQIKDIAVDIATDRKVMSSERAQEHLEIMMRARRLKEPANERIVRWALCSARSIDKSNALDRATEIVTRVGDWAEDPHSQVDWLMAEKS